MIMCTVCECFNHVTISPKYVSTLWTRQADPDSAQAASKLLRRSEDLQDGLDRGSCHTGLIPYDNNMSTLRLSYRALGRVEEGTGGLTGEIPSQTNIPIIFLFIRFDLFSFQVCLEGGSREQRRALRSSQV